MKDKSDVLYELAARLWRASDIYYARAYYRKNPILKIIYRKLGGVTWDLANTCFNKAAARH